MWQFCEGVASFSSLVFSSNATRREDYDVIHGISSYGSFHGSVGQFMGTFMIAFGVVHWQMQTWAGDNLKTVGMTFAIIHTVFLGMNIYHMAFGPIPSSAMNIGGLVPGVILTGLFYLKSR